MKRIVIMTVILFVLSLGGLAMMTLLLCRAQDKVEFTCVAQRGDAAVAEGLHLTEKGYFTNKNGNDKMTSVVYERRQKADLHPASRFS